MAKYSKAAGKTVKSAVKRMKKGTLTSGKSDKKVTSRKQAIAIGLSEAREKGAKVPAKKAGGRKAAAKKAAPAKKVAAKKVAAKKVAAKKAAPKKSAAKKAPAKKKMAPRKAAVKKAAPAKKAAPKKAPVKKKASAPKSGRSGVASSKSKAKMPGETSDSGEFISTPPNPGNEPVTNADINNIVTPEAETDKAVFSDTAPDEQYMPEDYKASVQDPYHGNVHPSKAKTSLKPAGKKPLWDNRK